MKKLAGAALSVLAALAFAAQAQAKDGISTIDMTGNWGVATLEKGDVSVKLSSPGGKGKVAALASKEFAVADTASEWKLSFSAKGDVAIQAMVTNKTDAAAPKGERQDILKTTKLKPDEWTPISVSFKMPEGTARSSLAIFIWEDKGSFEIKDLTLAPVAAESK